MLDQSFSAENFVKIFDDENRKGNDLASRFFPKVKDLNNQIRNENIKLRKNKSGLSKEQKAEIRRNINLLKENREVELKSYLEKLEHSVLTNTKASFKINLTKDDSITSKPVYLIAKDDAVSYFIIKQIQRNIRKLYKVKQSDRHQIVSQLSTLLDNKFPKYLIRTDIKEFYESIPHDSLLEIIDHENLLSHTSKEYVKSILNKYKSLSGRDKGLPRGIGISAYLAELFMRDFDSKVKLDDEVIFYGRYVDDVVVLYAQKPDTDELGKIKIIRKLAKEKGLNINSQKTKKFVLPSNYNFDYLGYQFQAKKIPNIGYVSTLDMSLNKLNKYKHRIQSTFSTYNQTPTKYRRKASKALIQRVSFLTSNTKLYGNKSGTLIGIHFSNKLITMSNLKRIELIDKYLTKQINSLSDPALKARLSACNFKKGFVNKTFHKFSTQQIKELVKAWG
ncbi:MAG: antiviral reverse transcriptase Drt3a [Methylophilus sp.]